MKKIKNNTQPYALYIFATIILLFVDFFIGFCFYLSLLVFDGFNFWSIFGTLLPIIFFYLTMRAIKNGILYFIPREECYIENSNLIYKRILFNKFIFKEIKISLLNIQNIIDRGSYEKIRTNGDYLNPLNYITTFFRPYERILIELKSGEKYKIFVDANPYPRTEFLPYYDNNKFIKNYNDLKEMVIEEQNKLSFNQKVENLRERYNFPLDERYNYILNKIIDEEKLFISENNNFIINGDSEAIKDLEIFKNMNFKEIDFYLFYVNYLSKKEYENKKVLVGYNGIDGKEITMLKLKEDINKIRDSRSTFKN